jgi:hypothetical protein
VQEFIFQSVSVNFENGINSASLVWQQYHTSKPGHNDTHKCIKHSCKWRLGYYVEGWCKCNGGCLSSILHITPNLINITAILLFWFQNKVQEWQFNYAKSFCSVYCCRPYRKHDKSDLGIVQSLSLTLLPDAIYEHVLELVCRSLLHTYSSISWSPQKYIQMK